MNPIIKVSSGLFKSNFLESFFQNIPGKIVIVADENIKELYGVDLAKKLSATLLTIPTGERNKNQETATCLMHKLFEIKADRETTLIALGGGVTTDLVGFVASIYLRSIPLIFMPTTLLAIVDASIGGKTAVNTSFGKNLIGTYYQPKAIFVDLDTLHTLAEKEWFNGFAEILKIALIQDCPIWEIAQKNKKDPSLIFKAMERKIAITQIDPIDLGLRRILNFGHTIAHALEAISKYEIAHGEAVAIGTLTESYLSMQLGYLSEKDFQEIYSTYQNFSLKVPKGASKKLLQAIKYDKKRASGESRFVLIDKIGHAMEFDKSYCRAVLEDELISTIDWIKQYED